MKREEKRKKNCIYIINNLETFGTKKKLTRIKFNDIQNWYFILL